MDLECCWLSGHSQAFISVSLADSPRGCGSVAFPQVFACPEAHLEKDQWVFSGGEADGGREQDRSGKVHRIHFDNGP